MTGFSEEVLRFRQSAEARLTRRLLVVVVGLVALIGLGLVASEIWVGQHQQSIEVFTHTLNTAGRQRALSQQVLLHATHFISATDPDARFESMTALFNAARLMRTEQDSLYNQSPLPQQLVWLYDSAPINLRERVINYTEAAIRLSQAEQSVSLGSNHPDYEMIVGAASQLLTDLETTTTAYEQLLRDSVRQMREMERGTAMLVFMGLSILGVVVVWPARSVIKRYVYQLYSQISMLSHRVTMMEQRQHFSEALTSSLPLPFLVYEVQTRRVVYISSQYRTLMGYSDTEEDVGELYDLDSTLHPDDRARALACMKKALDTGEMAVGTYRMRQRDGDYLMVESSTLVMAHNGKAVNPPQLVSMLRPLEAVRPTLPPDGLRDVLDSLNPVTKDTVFVYDLVGQRLLYVSPSIEQLLGYSAAELLAMDWKTAYTQIIHPDELSQTAARVSRYIGVRDGETREELMRVLHRSGHPMQLYMRFGISERMPNGDAMVLVGLCSDLRMKSLSN
ncbi:MAG: PAS domain-containing protein [Anaerolineae bacterium]|jgi:PAS domain S-box-containing protein|nr:PAS domain-containing protein [Anaerolineae bacterium]